MKLTSEELKELKHRALLYQSNAMKVMSLQTDSTALKHFKEYHHYLGNKYGYDPKKVNIDQDGEITNE